MNELRLPATRSIFGTIAEIKALEGAEYEMLRRDTTVLTIITLDDVIETVWVSADQILEYNLTGKLFIGNIVGVKLAQNVEGETYYEDADGTRNTHEATFESFVGLVNAVAVQLSLKGVPQFIIEKVVNDQAAHEASAIKPATRFHGSRATAQTEDAKQSRIDILLDKMNKTSNAVIKANILGTLKELGYQEEVTAPEGKAPKAK